MRKDDNKLVWIIALVAIIIVLIGDTLTAPHSEPKAEVRTTAGAATVLDIDFDE